MGGAAPGESECVCVWVGVVLPAWERCSDPLLSALPLFPLGAGASMLFLPCLVPQGEGSATLNMEAEFLSLGLDIIGLGVFNYEFGSITSESPVIKVWGGVGCTWVWLLGCGAWRFRCLGVTCDSR